MFCTANILSASKVSLYFYRVSNSTTTLAIAGPPLLVDLCGDKQKEKKDSACPAHIQSGR